MDLVLRSVNVGLPREVTWKGKTIRTAIFKTRIVGVASVGPNGIACDGQADL